MPFCGYAYCAKTGAVSSYAFRTNVHASTRGSRAHIIFAGPVIVCRIPDCSKLIDDSFEDLMAIAQLVSHVNVAWNASSV